MERGEKSGEREAEKEENLGEKLRRRVLLVSRRKGGPSTPVRLLVFAREPIITLNTSATANPSSSSSSSSRCISARKLAAALWEFHHYFPLSSMHRGLVPNGVPPRLRRLKDKDDCVGGGGGDFKDAHFIADPSPSSPDQPESASSLRRHVTASLLQHHRLVERGRRAIQPLSPASYGSSMEVTPYNPAVTPSSSLDYKGRINDPHCSLKTSTELLKVLNRIWSLEEQHTSNISLIKALKTELDHARARIKELLRNQQSDHREMDALMKQIAEDNLVRKTKEQDKIHAAVQSTREELEDERKLRKRSESLHRKLARELSDAKSSLSNALMELEKERKSRKLLEDLCDEFAIGIREYEHEVHALKQKGDKEWAQESDHDRLILHVAESWLDERMQMKLEEAEGDFMEKGSIVDKLSFELETFLQAKKKGALRPRERRKSMESMPLNEATSGPRDMAGEDDSDGSDSNCFELQRQGKEDELKAREDEAAAEANIEEEKIEKATNLMKTKVGPRARRKARNPSSLQVKFEEQMARALLGNRSKNSNRAEAEKERTNDGVPPEIGAFAYKPDEPEGKNKSSESVVNDFIKNQLMMTGVGEIDAGEASCSNYSKWMTHTSPVRQWMVGNSLAPDLDVLESSSKLPPALKDNTLKAKLMEARSKGQKSRFRAPKDPSGQCTVCKASDLKLR
ncbi:uncharacterized protein At5g41620 isoform X2 [Punica granatum]|uniref:Uncharacterized protein At5g41620 isoform X2 n=1 Tax=Punica granatum TaxID=22663 RepID=A0A6P8EB19_PUNGR|nr:uncharacterized protein At5g41620 isoform X2 [Punica granatum]